MRKELKSKSRRKWLLGGSLAFASVALLTTGFATWVIGTQKTSGDDQVHIGVDTVQDKSVELTFNLDANNNRITVAEDAEKSSNTNLPIEKTVTPNWNIKIQDLNIAVGETLYNSLKAKQKEKQEAGQDLDLKIAFELQKGVTEGNINSVTNDIVGGRTGSSWNYIDLATKEFNVALPDSYPVGGKICDINDTSNNPNGYITNPDPKGDNKTISFTWGSYFGEKAPSVFYKENQPTEGLREYYQKASQELQAMNTALNNGELKLTATFVYPKVGE